MATFKAWTKPGTTDQRIYISGLAGQRDAKVFVTKCVIDCFGSDFEIKVQAGCAQINKGQLENYAEEAINEAAKCRANLFEQVLKIAG